MAQIQKPDHVKKEYVQAMGEHLGPIFHALWEEVAWLYFRWHGYRVSPSHYLVAVVAHQAPGENSEAIALLDLAVHLYKPRRLRAAREDHLSASNPPVHVVEGPIHKVSRRSRHPLTSRVGHAPRVYTTIVRW